MGRGAWGVGHGAWGVGNERDGEAAEVPPLGCPPTEVMQRQCRFAVSNPRAKPF